jgi:hypothetical protein
MTANMRIFLGMIGGLVLMSLNSGPFLLLGGLRDWITAPLFSLLFGLISLAGLIAVLICSFYLIVDAFRAINRR